MTTATTTTTTGRTRRRPETRPAATPLTAAEAAQLLDAVAAYSAAVHRAAYHSGAWRPPTPWDEYKAQAEPLEAAASAAHSAILALVQALVPGDERWDMWRHAERLREARRAAEDAPAAG